MTNRTRRRRQAHIEEMLLSNVDVAHIVLRIGKLQEELEPDDEAKAQQKELRQSRKDLKGLIRQLKLAEKW